MTKWLIVLLLALAVEAVGVVFLSKGLKQIDQPARITLHNLAGVVRRGAANSNILLGVALEAAFFGALLYLLSQKDVSLIWPLTALGFVLTTVAGRLFLHEQVSAIRWLGVILIVTGALLVRYSEKDQAAPDAPPPGKAAEG
jgi:multidrug transporter EmrE-like cation transporter